MTEKFDDNLNRCLNKYLISMVKQYPEDVLASFMKHEVNNYSLEFN